MGLLSKEKVYVFSLVPKVPLGADVGADAEVDVEAGLLRQLHEPDQVVPVAEVVLRGSSKNPSAMNSQRRQQEMQSKRRRGEYSNNTWPFTGSWPFQKT